MARKTRRNFLIASLAAAGGVVSCKALTQTKPNVVPLTLSTTSKMPERVLGKTGITLPILGLGGAGQTPLSKQGREADAIALIEKALQLGIRYFDTAASYGPSEDYLGKVLPQYRQQIFLASKTAARDRDGAWQELERSLQRLNTDQLDLWQLHHVSYPEHLEAIFAKDGAIRAIEEAKQQKIIRFSGITGHHEPQIIAEGLNRHPFDTTLVSINAADRHHPRPFAPTVLPVAQKLNVGVIAMKVPAYGRLLKPGILTMRQAMGYSLSLTGVHCCIIAAESSQQLADNVAVASQYQPLAESVMKDIETLTANVWEENTFFRAWG
ncbi:MAG: aldo/keto reductase [Thermosynechococcaceae cyanobacterium]